MGDVRLPCSAKNLYLPRYKKLPHKTPATTKAKQIFARVMAGVLWGSSGWVREVWRVGRPLRKGSPCASKVFPLPPHSFSDQRLRFGNRTGSADDRNAVAILKEIKNLIEL